MPSVSDREVTLIIKADGSAAIKGVDAVSESFKRVKTSGKDAETGTNAVSEGFKRVSESGKKAQSGAEAAGAGIKKAGADASKTKKDIGDLTDSFFKLSTGVNQAMDILNRVGGVAKWTLEMAAFGASVEETRQAFSSYARSIGVDSNAILEKLKRASGGTISEFQLIQSASKAMSLGVTKDGDQLAKLLEIARNKARLFGSDTAKAFEDIVIGIGRTSPLILDNLGIRIPASFEKMTRGMSEAEKVAQLAILTIEEGSKQLSEMGGMVDSTADSFRKFEVAISEGKSALGGYLSQLTPLLVPLSLMVQMTAALARNMQITLVPPSLPSV
ncbi:MAG: hypothetical protein HQM10_26755, partial [Candidatus Riflebacteria bacterium]|nr:hypothetical protein [Candidatus Riflebacteria bacterium]